MQVKKVVSPNLWPPSINNDGSIIQCGIHSVRLVKRAVVCVTHREKLGCPYLALLCTTDNRPTETSLDVLTLLYCVPQTTDAGFQALNINFDAIVKLLFPSYKWQMYYSSIDMAYCYRIQTTLFGIEHMFV